VKFKNDPRDCSSSNFNGWRKEKIGALKRSISPTLYAQLLCT
jgi:hypothetical protein